MADQEAKETDSGDKAQNADEGDEDQKIKEESTVENTRDEGHKAEDEKENQQPQDKKRIAGVKPPPVRIEIKSSQQHYQSHIKSTLPHILAEYGMEEELNKNQSAQKPHRPRKKKKRDQLAEDAMDERRPRSTKDKYSLLYDEASRSNKYYEEYCDQLELKVERQRREKKQREEEEEQKRQEQLELEAEDEVPSPLPQLSERQLRHFPPKRLQKHALVSDDEFIRNLHKTDLARIVGLQDRLRREGKLKTQVDVDHFWSDIKKPEVFYTHFKKQKKSTDSEITDKVSGSVFSRESSLRGGSFHARELPEMPPRSLSHISERIEASRQEQRGEPWAITQMFPHHHEEKPEKPRPTSAQLAKQAALDLERRCPKLEMPPLACFNLDLGEKPPDPEVVKREIALKVREKNRKKLMRKIRKMHQLAMANSAAANRIMAKHGDLTQVLEGTTLRDLMAVWDSGEEEAVEEEEGQPVFLTEPSEMPEMLGTQLPEHVHEQVVPLERASQTSSATRSIISDSRSSSKKSSSRARRKKLESPQTLPAIEYPPPLTFAEMEKKCKIMEPKCLSTFWTNYAHAGKSVFAPS